MNLKPTKALFVFALTAAAVLWSYWPEFCVIAEKWRYEEEYSHGWLVPFFSILLLYLRIPLLDKSRAANPVEPPNWKILLPLFAGGMFWYICGGDLEMTPLAWAGLVTTLVAFGFFIDQSTRNVTSEVPWIRWVGLLLVLIGCLSRLFAVRYNAEWIDHISLIPLLLGLACALGGENVLSWSAPSILYLAFMVPFPYRLEVAMRQPLRQLATTASTFTLQTLGYPAFSEGNLVMVEDVRLDIVEACSGLSMLMVFFAISCAVAILSNRQLWQRIILVCSAVPIALFSNIVRITVQGLLFIHHYDTTATWFHDHGAPWLMMGIAMGLLLFELWYLDRLIIVELKEPVGVGLELPQ